MLRRSTVGAMSLACLLGVTFAQEPDTNPAVTAVTASMEVERQLLAQDRKGWDDMGTRRRAVDSRIVQLRQALDGAIVNQDVRAAELLDRLAIQMQQAEGERSELQVAERVLIDRIADRLRRIALYEERLVELRVRPQVEVGALSGVWDVVLLPSDQRGTFELKQTGAVVTGTYRLAGGFSGSLSGTLVKNKVYLERIDSQLGRSMDFEGRVSADLAQILGTWQSYELSRGEGASGQWSARRRTPDELAE